MTIDDVLTSKGIEFHYTSKAQIQANCPVCGDRRRRLGINLAKQVVHCFRGSCGYANSIDNFAKWLGVLTKLARDNNFLRLGLAGSRTEKVPVVDLPSEFRLLTQVAEQSLFSEYADYADKRGVTRQYWDQYKIGVCDFGLQGGRIIFPVFDWNNRLLTYFGRSIYGDEPKYLFPFQSTRGLWGLNTLATATTDTVVVTEGAIKSFALMGQDKSKKYVHTASLGNVVTLFQVNQIVDAGFKKVHIIPDPGEAGLRGLLVSSLRLKGAGVKVTIPRILPELQLDEMPESERPAVLDAKELTLITEYKIRNQLLNPGL